MKVQKILYTVCVIALAIPMMANAEIYKWKDKSGVTRYSDVPPSARIKVDVIGKTGAARPSRPVATEGASPVRVNEGAKPQRFKEPEFETNPGAKNKADKLREKNAAADKINQVEKKKLAKLNAENCKVAKANYQSYAQGGRIYKMNENGERIYMDDAGLAVGKAQAQGEINKYCK